MGMMQQVMEDTMDPLQLLVVKKELPSHPLHVAADTSVNKAGQENTRVGWTAAKLVGGTTFDTIEEVVQRPAEAMRFLQGIARALAHEGKPVVWHTPMGLPVVLHYPNHTSERLQLWMMDRGVRVRSQITAQTEAPGIDKNAAASAVAPCFVHSYDACHLQMVVKEAGEQGIENVALVHDSFGCHAGLATQFRSVISHTFYHLYTDNDPLSMVLEESKSQLLSDKRLPSRDDVSTGDYSIEEVCLSSYAFA
jgi:DNA-directed RNA polymerase